MLVVNDSLMPVAQMRREFTTVNGRRICAAATVIMVSWIAAPGAASAAPDSSASLSRLDNPIVTLPQASSTRLLKYPSTSIRGTAVTLSASLSLPKGKAPQSGWPLVVWNHMTTGGADACAPTAARRGSTALADMTSGDRIVSRLLTAGVAVLRPDYEGLGSVGPHPYLIGASLATAVIDAARAAVQAEPRLGRTVALAGHSEGAVAALFAAAAPQSRWGSLRVRSVAAVTPPTRMAELVDSIAQGPFAAGGATGELVGLAALMITGASAAHPDFARLVADGGVSSRARALLPLVEKACYRDLAGPRAFGALAPADVLGPAGRRLRTRLVQIVGDNDVARLRLPPGVPIRVDAGPPDVVAPAPFLDELSRTYRSRGCDVTFDVHRGGHSAVPRDPETAASIAAWIVRMTM